MRKARFDERLDIVIAEALKRLSDRMQLAYLRGDLPGYLMRIGLLDALPEGVLTETDFSVTVKRLQGIVALRIKRARQKGYLKDYLRQINMTDLLLAKKRVRTMRLRTVAGGKNGGDDSLSQKPHLMVVK